MTMSKRERMVAIVTGAALGLLVLDQLILGPLLARQTELASQIDKAQSELEHAQRVFGTSRRVTRTWNTISRGALRPNASDAESQVLYGVRDWGQESGLALASVKPLPGVKEKGFDKIALRATGAGGMEQVARFIYQIESAKFPVRLEDVQISSRKEGADDLSLNVGVATIYLTPEQPKPDAATGGR